jgi:signal recognition particle GTPase
LPRKKTRRRTNTKKASRRARAAFADRLQELSSRYKEVNEAYFEELEQILIEADVGVSLTLKLVEELLAKRAKTKGSRTHNKINEELIDLMFVGYVEKGSSIVNDVQFVKSPGRRFFWSKG